MSKIKKKVSVLTQQDLLEHVAKSLHWFLFGPFERTQAYKPLRDKLDALPRPLTVEAINQVLKEENLDDAPPWREGRKDGDAFKPRCDLCETQRDWVLVLHETCEHDIEADDLAVCEKCIDELMLTKIKYLEAYQKELEAKLEEKGDA